MLCGAGRLGSAWPQDQLPAAGLDGSGTQPRGRGLALPVGGNDLGADTGDASGESSLSQRHIDQAVIQQALNAILGSDHPASVRFATMIREIEAEMDADDPLPVPELFESIVVYAYAGTLSQQRQVALGMKIIGDALHFPSFLRPKPSAGCVTFALRT